MDEHRYRQAEAALFADAGIKPDEQWIRLATVGTRARVLAIGDGVPAVFFTGGPMAAATWAYCAAAAATSGMRCLLVERPGTGLAPALAAPPRVDDFPTYQAALVADVLDALALDRVSLVGSSLGGSIALRAAAAMPERVERVVLAGCPAFVPGWTQPQFFTLLRTPVLGRLLLAAPVTGPSVRMGLRQMGHARSLDAGRIPAAMLDWERAWQRHTDTMRNDAAMIVRLGTRRGGFDAGLDLDGAVLAAVHAPSLVLIGTDDPVGGEPVARNLASSLPSATVEVLDGFGHLPWLDDAALVADRIREFVRATQLRPSP